MNEAMMTENEIRDALVDYSRRCIKKGLSDGTAGNISMRFEDHMFITPSGVPPEDMDAAQIAEVFFDGRFNGPLKPSSEWELHARLYESCPDARAIVHAHPMYCVAQSILRKPIPSFHYMIASFGGNEVPCAPYARFGTGALAKTVVETMGTQFSAVLMANHGMITIGKDIKAAFSNTAKLEVLAKQYHLAKVLGEIVLLSKSEMTEVHEVYRKLGYGRPTAVKT